jgi:hypothetical protein
MTALGRRGYVIDLVFAGDADGVVLLNAIPLGKADRLLTRSCAPILAISLPTFNVPQVLVGERDAAAAVVEQLLALPQPIQPVVEAALRLARERHTKSVQLDSCSKLKLTRAASIQPPSASAGT